MSKMTQFNSSFKKYLWLYSGPVSKAEILAFHFSNRPNCHYDRVVFQDIRVSKTLFPILIFFLKKYFFKKRTHQLPDVPRAPLRPLQVGLHPPLSPLLHRRRHPLHHPDDRPVVLPRGGGEGPPPGAEGEDLPQEDAEAPHVGLGRVLALEQNGIKKLVLINLSTSFLTVQDMHLET